MAHRRRRTKPSTNLAADAAIGSHAYKRLDQMTRMPLIVAKLIGIARPPIQPPYQFSCQAATYQAGTGSRADGTQAAHNLPADLTLNGRSIWAYVRDGHVADANARLQLQIEYSAAATVTVPRLANHLDSQWEKNGLIEAWLGYVRLAVDKSAGLGQGGPLNPALRAAAVAFQDRCAATLETAIQKIEASAVFQANQDALDGIFDIYADKVQQYDPGRRLDALWRTYARPDFR
jgi:hypothetical protein